MSASDTSPLNALTSGKYFATAQEAADSLCPSGYPSCLFMIRFQPGCLSTIALDEQFPEMLYTCILNFREHIFIPSYGKSLIVHSIQRNFQSSRLEM
jgi:hypothetical protein